MSSSSSSVQPRYQVFLSFRGEDTRHSFTSHLLKALRDSGIHVFFDENELKRGEELTPALLKAIEASKISVIVLSKDYASSKSCLAELSKIMDCKDSPAGQIILPIFYRVNPSDARHHSGPFEESFHQHLKNKPEEAERWKDVFTQVGSFKGWHIDGGNFDRSESGYIEDIVKVVVEKLRSKSTSVPKHYLVGMDDHIGKLKQLIDQDDTRVIGIWGMGGIGKTTLAEVVYNEEVVSGSKFGAHLFLRDVRERSEKYGMQSLQNELLLKLLKEDIKIDTPTVGSEVILDRLNNVRALVVLDDVSNLDQIDGLGVKHLGPGSKIIVTSRDRQVLKNIGANEVYKLEGLNDDDSLELFCNFAFKQYNPIADFWDLSMKFLSYARGQPLALKVLGAALYQKDSDVWESALEKLKEYPEKLIFGPLKISFDGLGCLEQNIFLDVACFFKGGRKDSVTKMLEGFYKGARFGISNLVDKCLLDDRSDYLWMHDLLQEMGRDFVRQESEDPGRRSRLWSAEDVYHVFKYNKGTRLIKGISVDMSELSALHIHPAIFRKMVNLVFIRFYCKDFSGDNLMLENQHLNYLPDGLRYFRWDYSPLKSLPSNFNPHNLVELRFPNSNIEQLWDGDQEFVNLRGMDLSGCKNIRKIPTLSGATKLETVDCEGCVSLTELPCMMHLISLKNLQLSRCVSLTELPCMMHLISLKNLQLSHCPISKFPEIPSNLEELNLGGTQIEELPSSIGSLKKLRKLNMSETKVQNIPSSIWELDALDYLSLCNCPNITELNLTPLEEVSSSTPRLQRLRFIWVYKCKSLKSLSGVPPWLRGLHANDNISLEKVSFSLQQDAREIIGELPSPISRSLDLRDCKRLKSLSGLPPCIDRITATNCTSLQSVSFTDHDHYDDQRELSYGMQEFTSNEGFHFGFNNCFSLNRGVRDNIFAACTMSKLQAMAKQSAKRLKEESHQGLYMSEIERYGGRQGHYHLPGSEIFDKFENQSRNSSITVKLADSAASRSRFLCFALCLVFDYENSSESNSGEFNIYRFDCIYQLKDADGVDQNFSKTWKVVYTNPKRMGCSNEHVFALFKDNMVHLDMNYKEASFEFKVVCRRHFDCYEGGLHRRHRVREERKVEKCGVHVFHIDAESLTVSDAAGSSSEEGSTSCSPNIISPNSVSPIVHSLPLLTIQEDASVGNIGHGLKALLL